MLVDEHKIMDIKLEIIKKIKICISRVTNLDCPYKIMKTQCNYPQ